MLQWLPGHLELLPRWLAHAEPARAARVPGPGQLRRPAPRAAAGVLRGRPPGGTASAASPSRHEAVHTPAAYADALAAAGARPDVWETTYLHRLEGPDPVLAWTSGTALRPVLAALDDEPAARRPSSPSTALPSGPAYPPDRDGVTTFPFRRIFAVAAPA